MKSVYKFLGIVFLAFLLSSCTRYYTIQKKHQIRDGAYSLKDTLYISDVILCSTYDKGMFGKLEDFPVNKDSVFDIFTSSLSKLALNIEFDEEISFHCDSSFFYNNKMKMTHINNDFIISTASKNPKRVSLIPIIRLYTSDLGSVSITASGGGNIGYRRDFFAGIVAHIVKDGNIIYARMYDFSGRTGDFYSDGSVDANTIEQKHWDKLLELTMRDYIKRLK